MLSNDDKYYIFFGYSKIDKYIFIMELKKYLLAEIKSIINNEYLDYMEISEMILLKDERYKTNN